MIAYTFAIIFFKKRRVNMVEKRKFSSLSIITAVTFGIMVLLNVLANVLLINGQNTGEVSDAYANLFAPAGYTFSILGIIYLLLGAYTLYQLGFFRKDELEDRESLLNNINILFSVSSVANAIWILTWHYEKMLLATILIIVILICLILINLRIERSKLSLKEKMFIYLPFNVYFGWLTVATIANITTFLVSTGWGGFGISEDIWTAIILIVGFLIAGLVIMRQRNIAYGLVILWSYIGIYVKHISKDGWNSEFPLVTTTVTVLIVLIIITMLYTLFVIKKKAKKETVGN